MYASILVTSDGSDLALRGIEQGLTIALAFGAGLTVLTVSAPAPEQGMGRVYRGQTLEDLRLDPAIRAHFEQVLERAEGVGIGPTFAQVFSELPALAIVSYAKEAECDMIVMTSHGESGPRADLLGSQTAEVLAATTLPVLVVR